MVYDFNLTFHIINFIEKEYTCVDAAVSIKFYSKADLTAIPNISSSSAIKQNYAKYFKHIEKTYRGKVHCRHCVVDQNQT